METILIQIGENKCEIIPDIKSSDIEIVKSHEEISHVDNNRYMISKIISSKTKTRFTAEYIYYQDEIIINSFIQKCLEKDKVLQYKYKNFSEITDKYERFIRCIDSMGLMYERKKRYRFYLDKKDYLNNVSTLNSMEILNEYKYLFEKTGSSIKECVSIIQESLNRFFESSGLSELITTLKRFVKSIPTPLISADLKEVLIKSYIEWGKMGWTPPPNSNLYIFSESPGDYNSANKIIRSLTNKEEMKQLFDKLLQLKGINKFDLAESIETFNQRKYKSCALILFTLIDALLIRSQNNGDRNRRGLRPTGKRAGKNIFERIKEKNDNNMIFLSLRAINLLEALNVLFDSGNDFRVQPKVINRNFLCHGMLHRRVSRKDCVMLFLFIYNFVSILDLTYS